MDKNMINENDGYAKRTHILECEVCGRNDYVESIGLWDHKGYLIGALCGECEIADEDENSGGSDGEDYSTNVNIANM